MRELYTNRSGKYHLLRLINNIMIKEFEKFHGMVLARMIHDYKKPSIIEPYPSKDNSSYIINNKIGIYIKYSKKRLSPWRFSFTKEHQDEIQKMKKKLKMVFVVFVCNDDGIAALSFNELKLVLNEDHKETEWVAIKRRTREKYSVSGSDGKLKFKIGECDFPGRLFVESKLSIIKKIFT